MTYAYIRVSTKEQNLDRQIPAVKKYRPELKDENIFSDKQSGKNFDRKNYLELKSLLQPGDELIIKELDRLGRNKQGIKEELQWFKDHGIIVRILDVPTTLIDFKDQKWVFDMVNNILIEVMASVAEEERIKIQTRRKEGIAAMPVVNGKRISKKTGNPIGRRKLAVPDFQTYTQRVQEGKITVSGAVKALGISRRTWYNLAKECA
jgi:DNA invertase Pin-like site-specific DNA recombinase